MADSRFLSAKPVRLLAIFALFGALGGIGYGVMAPGASVAATAERLSALTRYLERSPGERGSVDPLKTKAAKPALVGEYQPLRASRIIPGRKPVDDSAIPDELTPQATTTDPVAIVLPGDTSVGGGDGLDLLPIVDAPAPRGRGRTVSVGGPGGGSGGGAGGGGTGGESTPPSTNTPPTGGTPPGPVVAAVPEPSTWAMLMIGMGLIGGIMRRRRSNAGKTNPVLG